jgi:hypothetical protein
MFTLDEKGINWMDAGQVRSEVGKALNKTNLQFGVTIRGAPPANISVGCICSPSEMTTLQGILSSLNLNGEGIRFTATRIDPGNISLSHRHNVIFLWDYDLTGRKAEVLNYLEAGKGIVEVRDLDSADIDPVQADVFGLSWNNSLNPGSGTISFSTSTTSTESFAIKKYFHHIPNSTGQTYPEPHQFQNFLSSGERVWQRNNDTKRIAMVQDVSGTPACIINYGVSGGFGRTAWLSGIGSVEDDERILIKSLILWAAGSDYEVVKGDIVTGAAKFSFLKVLNQNMYQPVEIVMTIGYLY